MDYIKVPSWFSKEKINSTKLIKFINNAEFIADDKIDLNCLRDLFKSNRSEALDTIDELSLRGFEFYSERSSNLLPSFRYNQEEEIIFSKENNNKYRDIDFKILGLGNIVSRFNINSDYFFNYIPISGFKAVTNFPEYNLIKNEFVKNGFIVQNTSIEVFQVNKSQDETLSNDELSIAKIIEEFNVRNYFNSIGNDKINEIDSKDINDIRDSNNIGDNKYSELSDRLLEIYIKSSKDDSKGNVLIADVFNENRYNAINRYFYYNNKFYIKDIGSDDVLNIPYYRGVGVKKVIDFKERLLEFFLFNKKDIVGLDDNIVNELDTSTSLDINYDIDEKKKGLEGVLESYDIGTVFNEGKFNLIRIYFQNIGITNINQISNDTIKSLPGARGIGKKKLDDFIITLDEIINNIRTGVDRLNNGEFIIDSSILEEFGEMSLNELGELLDIRVNNNDLLLRDLQGIKYSNFADLKDIESIEKLLVKILEKKDINQILSNIYNSLNEKEALVLHARYVDKYTLEDTGKILEVTRERARQIQKKAIKKIRLRLSRNNFIRNLKLELKNSNYFTVDTLSSLLDESNKFIIDIIEVGEIDNLYYYETIDVIYFNKCENDFLGVDKIIEELPDFGVVDDFIDEISGPIEKILDIQLNENQILELIESKGYKNYGAYLSRKRLSIGDYLDILFKYHIDGHFRFDEDSFPYILNLANKIFRTDFDWSCRSSEGRLRDSSNVILTDSRTYCHIDKLDINMSFISDIRHRLDDYLSKNSSITAEVLFEKEKKDCMANNIDNKVYLYSLIKYYYGDYYNMGRGNTLTIARSSVNHLLTNEEKLYNYLMKNGGKITKDEVMINFRWKKLALENTISNSVRVISFDRSQVALVEDIFKDDYGKNKLKLIVSESMKEGYSTTEIIKKKMIFDQDLLEVLTRNKINEASTIGGIVRWLEPNITGSTIFLTYKNTKYKNIYDVIIEKFPGITSRKELAEYLEDLMYKESTVPIIIRNLIMNKEFLEISMDELINRNDFTIDQNVIQALKDEVSARMGDNEYLSLTGMKKYRQNLPDIQYGWNPYLIKSILTINGFKDVVRRNGDYRNECVIVLKGSSKLNYFDELVYYLLTNEYQGNLHERGVYEYLVSLNLIKEKDKYNKKLPPELYNSDLLTIDNTGRIYLNEEQTCQILS